MFGKVGEKFLYCDNHRLYRLESIGRRKILDINSDIVYHMVLIEEEKYSSTTSKRLFAKECNFVAPTEYKRNNFIHLEGDFPDVHMYDGMKVVINNAEEHFVYGLKDDGTFTLIDKGVDPEIFLERYKGLNIRSNIVWCKRLFYSGWWKQI